MTTDEKQLSRFENINLKRSGLSERELFIDPVKIAKNNLTQYFVYLKLRDYNDLAVEPIYTEEQISLLAKYEELLEALEKHFNL